MASIGTQITEAFAGLDRIREILGSNTEDERDDERDGRIAREDREIRIPWVIPDRPAHEEEDDEEEDDEDDEEGEHKSKVA